MKGVGSKVLIALGAVLVLAAILWWTVGLSIVLKIPGGIEGEAEYEGEITWYIDPATQQPLPEGSEISVPYEAHREVESLDDEYDSSKAVLKETAIVTMAGMKQPPITNVYVIDRKSMENVEDDRSYNFSEQYKVDLSGSYAVFFPMNTSKEEVYPLWKHEIAQTLEGVFIGEEEKEGLKVYDFGIHAEKKEVWDSYLEFMGLPLELTFDEMKAQLTAMGVDVDGLLALASQVLTPEDLESLAQFSEQTIPLKYYIDSDAEISVEPKTGSIVDVCEFKDTMSMEPDYSGLMELFTILMKYQQDPTLGPALQQFVALQAQMSEAEPQKIMTVRYHQDPQSVSEIIQDTKDACGTLNLVKLWLPLIVVIVGALLLIAGVAWLMKRRA